MNHFVKKLLLASSILISIPSLAQLPDKMPIEIKEILENDYHGNQSKERLYEVTSNSHMAKFYVEELNIDENQAAKRILTSPKKDELNNLLDTYLGGRIAGI